ncbi:sugar-binding transcriptional regulator [Schaalia hyovaginalis]|uniref:DNA-binding transcriptional regulator LsrR (DeoR family) n=1 Tax=Schaalia hyovaginalis TaxID=29316 RepID=A0A923E3I8_9ACTO|nr:sugar-binding domain-containing protein [Schaalia hyovaginalis]MBB6333520.1 DNA-binding transcriptional regulator LsrR (DeoR family) [Schaalia hyovaginalis]
MTTASARSRDEETNLALMADVARRYYLDDESKVQIANALGMSRFQVARLLQAARAKGVVRIEVEHPLLGDVALARELRSALELDEVLLVRADEDVQVERERLGERAARYLSSRAKRGHRVGFSWGRTLLPVVERLSGLPEMEFVQVSGMVGNDPLQSPIGMLATISANSQLSTKALIAPLFSTTDEGANAVRHEPAVAEVLGLYDSLDAAYLSVGSWKNPAINQLAEHMTPDEIAELDDLGAVAEVVGLFFDANGDYIDTVLNRRRISVSVDQLKSTPEVVAVAGQIGKARAIRAIAASGIITCLVTTDEVAREILARVAEGA